MLRHNKSAMSVTFVCFDIAKLKCQMLNIMGISFLSLICPCMIYLKRKICKENKKQKDQNALNMIASVYSRRCESYRMYLKGDSPHQTIMIMCELKWFSHIPNCHNIYTYAILRCFSHTTHNILCYSWYMCRYNVIWSSQGLHVLLYAH